MNLNTDIAIKSYDLTDKLLELTPKYNDNDDNLIYNFHLYLIEFLNQEIVINENLDGKISENVFSINFGLLCNAAINNLKNNYWIFTPEHSLNTSEIKEEDYTYLREKYVLRLIYKLYGLEAEENFKEMIQYDWVNLLKQYSSSSKSRPGYTTSDHERFEANRRSQKTITLYLFMKPFVMMEKNQKNTKCHSNKKGSKLFKEPTEKPYSPSYTKSTCRNCQGSGRIERSKNIKWWQDCGKCEGQGFEIKPVLRNGEKYCKECKGKCRVIRSNNINWWQECEKCEGVGVEQKRFSN